MLETALNIFRGIFFDLDPNFLNNLCYFTQTAHSVKIIITFYLVEFISE
jgi:hypothetical protein